MILYPSVDDLLKQVNSRYSLIMLASKRAHELDAVQHQCLANTNRLKRLVGPWKKLRPVT